MTKIFGIKTSNIQGNKKTICSISLILILTMTLMMTFAQPALGQAGVPQPEKTAGYVTVAPTLVGVGQEATVNLWVFPLPTKYNYASAFNGFYGVEITFVRPDGTKDTFMPLDPTGSYIPGQMQSLGALYFFYKPNMAGNWSVSWTMPAQNITDSSGTVQFLGCTSNTFTFTVQTDPVLAGLLNGYPWAPLPNPNVYWSYPINANNREWYQISGDWTGITTTSPTVYSPTALRWQPYGSGPNTGHIVWTNTIQTGGIEGGAYGSKSYNAQVNIVVVMDGKVFANILEANPSQFICIDEATGKVLYQANGSISCGIHLPGSTYQQAASSIAAGEAPVLLEASYGSRMVPYLYGTSGSTWNYYNTLTGNVARQIFNASSSRLISGTVLAFGAGTITGQTGRYVYRWNMTSVKNDNWPTGITWKVPAPTTLTGGNPSIFAVSSDVSVVVIGTKNQYWGYDANTGAKLWNITLPYAITSNMEIPLANVDDFIVFDGAAATFHCYSIKTGAELWETPSFADSPWATTWTVYSSETNDLNNMYISFPDGSMRAYSLTDGHLIWTSKPIPSTEYANNVVPFVKSELVFVDGKLYVYAGYTHGAYQINPVPRFAMTVCINATTGDIIYTLNGGVSPSAAANGYVIGSGLFDGNLYCLGKGPTKTTVTASPKVFAQGSSVLIEGSVIDMSPASQDYTSQALFPNGVPAVADEDMSEWMDYLHMQNATLLNNPPVPNGVTIKLSAVGPNGNAIDLGTVTSDMAGVFKKTWTPPTEGEYTIYATFDGSNSYYSSYAETGLSISKAPTETSSTQQQTIPDYNTTIIYGVIAIIVVVAIVGALLFITLRKR